MKYAVIKTGGKQYRITKGDELEIEKLEGKKGDSITFNELLLLVDDEKVKIGDPLVEGAQVKAKILDQTKGKKLRVATFKAKSRYRRVKGHRQNLTRVKISSIVSK